MTDSETKHLNRSEVAESRIAAGAPFGLKRPETTTFVSRTTLSILQFLFALAPVAFDLSVYFPHRHLV